METWFRTVNVGLNFIIIIIVILMTVIVGLPPLLTIIAVTGAITTTPLPSSASLYLYADRRVHYCIRGAPRDMTA